MKQKQQEQKNTDQETNQKKKYRRHRGDRISFQAFFEPSLRRKVRAFLESGTPMATITKGVILTAALGGVLVVGAIAPNLFRAFRIDAAERGKRLNKEGFSRIRRNCYYLHQKGFLEPIPDSKENELEWRLSSKGESLLKKIIGMASKQKEQIFPKEWDQKWRLILFDIPTSHNMARDILRKELRNMGCYQFQRSVLIYPFPCTREVRLLAHQLDVEKWVEVCVIEDFRNRDVLSHFRPLLKQCKIVKQANQ